MHDKLDMKKTLDVGQTAGNHLLLSYSFHIQKGSLYDIRGFLRGSADKESACNVGDLSSIPELRRSPGEGTSYPLQDSGLQNSMDCIVHGVAKSQTWLSDFHFLSLLYGINPVLHYIFVRAFVFMTHSMNLGL